MHQSNRDCFHICNLIAVVLLGVQLAGCACLGRGGGRLHVVPFNSHYVAALEPEQVVKLMRLADFSTEQIRATGVDLRNALALCGGAKMLKGDHTVAIFEVHGRYIHAATSARGSFVFSTLTGDVHAEGRHGEPGAPERMASMARGRHCFTQRGDPSL
jgi:hypothetical protein